MIRVLLVDDEPLARTGLRVMLADEPDIEIVGEAGDGVEAVERILALRPDLVLLDVQMPGMDGFEVVRRVAPEHLPVVIFVTAYDAYALKAFEVHALDYLLKPPNADRLADALRRARRELSQEDRPGAAGLAAVAGGESAAPAAPATLRRFVVRERDRYLLVRDDEVVRIEAAGNYVEVHARGRVFLLRATLSGLAASLDPARFTRIHRSSIVNADRIQEITPDPSGDFVVRLDTGETLRMSRRYRDALIPRG